MALPIVPVQVSRRAHQLLRNLDLGTGKFEYPGSNVGQSYPEDANVFARSNPFVSLALTLLIDHVDDPELSTVGPSIGQLSPDDFDYLTGGYIPRVHPRVRLLTGEEPDQEDLRHQYTELGHAVLQGVHFSAEIPELAQLNLDPSAASFNSEARAGLEQLFGQQTVSFYRDTFVEDHANLHAFTQAGADARVDFGTPFLLYLYPRLSLLLAYVTLGTESPLAVRTGYFGNVYRSAGAVLTGNINAVHNSGRGVVTLSEVLNYMINEQGDFPYFPSLGRGSVNSAKVRVYWQLLESMQDYHLLALLGIVLQRIARTSLDKAGRTNLSPVVHLYFQVFSRRYVGNEYTEFIYNRHVVLGGPGAGAAQSYMELVRKIVSVIFEQHVRAGLSTFSPPANLHDPEVFLAVIDIAAGIDYVRGDGLPAPNALTSALRSAGNEEINQLLRRLVAFYLPPTLQQHYDQLSVGMPIYTDNNCIVRTYIFVKCWEYGVITQHDSIPKRRGIINTHVDQLIELITSLNPPAHNFYEILRYCFMYEAVVFPNRPAGTGVFRELVLCFFNGFDRPLKDTCVIIGLDWNVWPHRLVYTTPRDVNSLHFDPHELTNGYNRMVAVYHRGHCFPSTYRKFYEATQLSGPNETRIKALSDAAPPAPYHVQPRYLEDSLTLSEQKNATLIMDKDLDDTDLHNNVRILVPAGALDLQIMQCSMSSDFETGHCSACSAEMMNDQQDVFAAAVCWGTQRGQGIAFAGHECKHKAMTSTFDQYDGAITQMLRYLKARFGFYNPASTLPQHQKPFIKRRIYFFNGSKFDFFFLHKVLLFWNEKIDIVQLDTAILQIDWGNFEFVDFMRFYPGNTLDATYQTFRTFDRLQEYGIQLPYEDRKWQCFPYNLINDKDFDRLVSSEELESDAIWGDRRQTDDLVEGESIGQSNARWWKINISLTYETDDLLRYCLSDIYILQFMVELRVKAFGKGKETNGRTYNVNNAFTVSSAAWSRFIQGFLTHEFYTPSLDMNTKIMDPITNSKAGLQKLFRDAYLGGKTDVFFDGNISKEERLRYNALGLDHRLEELDVNSMYPSVMSEEAVPCTLSETDVLNWCGPLHPEGIRVDIHNIDDLEKTTLYHCSVEYPPGKSGMIRKFYGYCLATTSIPHTYKDPLHPEQSTFTMIYGIELIEAVKDGAVVFLRVAFRFKALPIFRDCMETIYAERLATSNKLIKTDKKLVICSIYGKTGQSEKSRSVLLYNDLDDPCETLDDHIVNFSVMPGPFGQKEVRIAHVVRSGKKHVGQLVYIGAFVTAAARAKLARYERELVKCVTPIGTPVRVYYCDTDSYKCDWFDPHLPGPNAEFTAKYIHQTKLGMLKSETDGMGFSFGIFLGKKLAMYIPYVPETWTLQDRQLLIERKRAFVEKHNKEAVVKSKGVPKKKVTALDLYDAFDTHVPFTAKMGLQFRRSMLQGIRKEEDAFRTIRTGNLARGDRLPTGELPPHPTFLAFEHHLKEAQLNDEALALAVDELNRDV